MKELNLPTTNKIVFSPENIDVNRIEETPEGNTLLSIVNDDDFIELGIARKNAGMVLWATICLEKKIEGIITDFFFGKLEGEDIKRHIFDSEILQHSAFQFNSKKHLIHEICNIHRGISGKQADKLQNYLKKIMSWRNAFAHGLLSIEHNRGITLSYYSGGHKEYLLNDEFWNNIEEVFALTNDLIDTLAKSFN